MNIQTGEVVASWDSLTPQEQASGQWVKLPPQDKDGYNAEVGKFLLAGVTYARRDPHHILRQYVKPIDEDAVMRSIMGPRGTFDANGKAR